ncbi:MAG: permease [Proteobacteria bacterium]|nr:permease [Pseudomonadota bacterium]
MTDTSLALGAVRRMDRVVLATLALFAGLLAVVPGQAFDSLAFTLDSLVFIAPFLLASVLVAASVKASGLDRQIAVVFSGRQAPVIVAAALFGALSPFCSCGVVPIIAALLASGVPLAPVMAFWIASPLMDPEMFVLMAPVMGLEFTLAKTLSAFSIGLIAGFATHALVARGAFANPLKAFDGGCGSGCAGSGLDDDTKILWRFWREDERRALFAAEARATGWFLFKWLTLAFLLESLMVAYVPAEAIASTLGGDSRWAIPLAVVVGVPAYLNGYAAIPTVSALVDLGMAPGAGLAFMVAGGVTSVPAAMAVFALVRRPVFLWYLALGLTGSLAAGTAYQAYVTL